MNIKEKYDKNLSKKNKGLNPLVWSTIIYDIEYRNQTNWYLIFSDLLDVCFKNASLFETIYDYIFCRDELKEKFLSKNLIQKNI